MALPRLATDAQLERISDAAFEVLETVGFLVQDEELRRRMAEAGCREGADGQVRIPERLVSEMLMPRVEDPEKPPEGPPRITWDPASHAGSQIAQFHLDPETGKRLPASRELLVEVVKFAHVWQKGSPVGPVLLCRDVPPPVEPMESALAIAEHTDQVGSAYVHYADQVPYLAQLGRIINEDERSFLGMCLFTVTPLRLDARAGALLRELVRRGAPVWIGTQPQSGASSPATVAGTVVLGAAEILAGWVAAHILDPEARPGAGICSGVLDMKSADVSFCAPEAMLQDLLCVELFRELYGGRCHVAGGPGYTDAKWPGSQKAFESAFEALTIYTYTGQGVGLGGGLLESGKTFSPVQFILDDEFARYLGRFARGVEFQDEDLALGSILEVGLGLKQSHLTSDHTLTHWRALYQPRLLDRACWRGDEEALSEERLLERARARYQEVRAAYEPASVGDRRLTAMREVVERAWVDLLGRGRPR